MSYFDVVYLRLHESVGLCVQAQHSPAHLTGEDNEMCDQINIILKHYCKHLPMHLLH